MKSKIHTSYNSIVILTPVSGVSHEQIRVKAKNSVLMFLCLISFILYPIITIFAL